MFAPISVILSALFLAPALPNGIQLVEIPSEGNSIEIVAGYASGDLPGFASVAAARSLALTAYAAGGDLKFFDEFERTGLRITVPQWATGMFTDQLAALFKEIPKEVAAPAQANDDFGAKVEEEIRNALVGTGSRTEELSSGSDSGVGSAGIHGSGKAALGFLQGKTRAACWQLSTQASQPWWRRVRRYLKMAGNSESLMGARTSGPEHSRNKSPMTGVAVTDLRTVSKQEVKSFARLGLAGVS